MSDGAALLRGWPVGLMLAVLAAVTLIVELQTLTFYLAAIAVALAVGSAIAFIGVGKAVVLGTVSVTALLSLPLAHMLRGRLLRPTTEGRQLEAEDVGQIARVASALPQQLRVEYRGTTWAAQLVPPGALPVAPGDLLRITGRQGNTLQVTVVDPYPTTAE